MRWTAAFTKCFKLLILLALLMSASEASAQVTAFTYQGRLQDGGTLANGPYDMEFKLFNTQVVGTGIQQGSTVTLSTVQVTTGIFTVQLDFGANAFPGTERFLEIAVKPAGNPNPFTILSPRQQLTATPYAVRSLNATGADNATSLGGVPANQFVQTNDARLTDARTPTAGSPDYVQNTTTQQNSSNFNISGDGTAGGTLSAKIVNATTQYDIGGQRVLSRAGSLNFFAGPGTGANNTGSNNAFFGANAGAFNNTGGGNSFFGRNAGAINTTGSSNAFFGSRTGDANTTGDSNAFFGPDAGRGNATGSFNTVIGASANVAANNLTNATAIGAGAVVSTSNTITLGRSGQQDTVQVPGFLTVDTNTLVVVPTLNRVGIGTAAPFGKLHVVDAIGANGSVILPNDAIAAAEILDEPGVASEGDSGQTFLNPTATAVLSRSITVPAAGFVLVIATCQAATNHTSGAFSRVTFGVSDSATVFPLNQHVNYIIDSGSPSGSYATPVTVHGLFSVVAGTHTFHLLGQEVGGSFFTEDSQLTLLFVPTSYGTVTPTAPAMALRQSGQALYEASTQDATRTENASTSTLLEQTQQLLSRVKASERLVASTSTSLEASKAENAELRSRLEHLESLLRDAKVNRDMMTHLRKLQLGPK